MITTIESKTADVREERPTEKFLLQSPLENGLIAATTVTVTNQDTGFAVEPTTAAPEETTASSTELLSQLASSAKKNVFKFPSSARAHANLGAALLKAGQANEAEKELRIALEAEPNHYLAAMTLAKLYTEQDKLSEAEQLYKNLIASGCSEIIVSVNLANIAISRGEYEQAMTIIQSATSLQPVARHYTLGLVRMQQGNYRESIKELKAALRADIRNPQLNHALGIAYVTAGDKWRAERHLKAALALDPNGAATVHALGDVLLEMKRADEAATLLHKYLEAYPSDSTARELLGRCYLDLSKPSMAKTQFKIGLENSESVSTLQQAILRCNLGVAYMRENQHRDAEREFVKSLELNDHGSPVPYENYARVLIFGFQDHRRALEPLWKSKRIFPESTVTRMLLAIVYSLEYEYEAGIRELEPIYSEDSLPEISSQLGLLYLRSGRISKALDLLRVAFLKHPGNTAIVNNLAYTLLNANQIEEADTILRSYPKDEEPYAELFATQGLLRLHLGDLDSARRLYKRAESVARKKSDKDLVKRVRQKMHLELAKYFIRTGNLVEAEKHLRSSKLENVKFYSDVEEIEAVGRLLGKKMNPR